eukprot:TRINITY_DN9599_c0_g1_i9.p1 TRINITY_DN9599_c0_g1~~TRINITY_DN9599_c0_g1_i9.p1  ORF type:complete len:117 (+),score=9.87 TRINITY_DN9599_c0_g1_i9:461-811(+)
MRNCSAQLYPDSCSKQSVEQGGSLDSGSLAFRVWTANPGLSLGGGCCAGSVWSEPCTAAVDEMRTSWKVGCGIAASALLAYAFSSHDAPQRSTTVPQIGRAVQQECRDRSRMPSSA